MRTLLAVILFVAIPAAHADLVVNRALVHEGILRWFDVYEPSRLSTAPVPLLLVLHGSKGSDKVTTVGAMGEFLRLAERDTFVAIYPNGTSPTTGKSGPFGSFVWNDCRDDAGPASSTADDVGFILKLIGWAAQRYPIDLQRVYVTGGSNGGMMAYRLALQLSSRIAAVGAIIANLPASTSKCPQIPGSPISVLIMNGTADPLMPWNGGEVAEDRGLVLSAFATRDAWLALLQPGAASHTRTLPDLDPSDGGAIAEQAVCDERHTQVRFYQVNGAGHTFPSRATDIGALELVLGHQNHDLETADVVWAFLQAQRLDTTPGRCGDGCLDPGEACDDGNMDDGDACSATCAEARDG